MIIKSTKRSKIMLIFNNNLCLLRTLVVYFNIILETHWETLTNIIEIIISMPRGFVRKNNAFKFTKKVLFNIFFHTKINIGYFLSA